MPNNGSLHLPLRPVGLHSDLEDDPSETMSQVESYSSFPSATDKVAVTSLRQPSSISGSAETITSATDVLDAPDAPDTHNNADAGEGIDDKDGKDGKDGDNEGEQGNSAAASWLSWFKEKFNAVKHWVKDKIHSDKSNDGS